jgi:hypothetical protein
MEFDHYDYTGKGFIVGEGSCNALRLASMPDLCITSQSGQAAHGQEAVWGLTNQIV